jgi:alkylation response protein AidB-like acyl-CoA dehydrogenase
LDFQLDEDQQALVDGLGALLRPYADVPARDRLGFHVHPPELQRALREAGFLDVVTQGLTTLDAGLVVIEASRLAAAVETGASALVWPAVCEDTPAGPVALMAGDPARPARFLPVAAHVLYDDGTDLIRTDLPRDAVEPVETIYAYPYGRLRDPAILRSGRRLGPAARDAARRRWRIAVALEFAGAAESALDFTVDYVKQRHVFGRPVGSFQAVQHRLAQNHQVIRGIRYAALYAAWKDDAESADIAANYAQRHAGKIVFDLHQFNGGMGVTNEHLLHFWTHRIRALQAEVGGATQAALDLADALWPRSGSAGREVTAPAEQREIA